MTPPSPSISWRIRHAREQARLEPKALREALARKGFDLSKTGLHRLETIEPTNPSVKLIEAIAEVTNVQPGWLLFGTGTALQADAAANAIRGRVLDTIELMSQALDMNARQRNSFDKWLASMRSTVPTVIERP
ncbi:MAG: helix-turn-helix domain-containing protein [Granulosicoccus sp.]